MDFDTAKSIIEVVALLSATLFFLYKVLEGRTCVNMSVDVESRRWSSDDPTINLLRIEVILTKGDQGMLALYDVCARVTSMDESTPFTTVTRFAGVNRLATNAANMKCESIAWEMPDSNTPNLRLSSGESTRLAAVARVPSRVPVLIDVAIAGRRLWSPMKSQWRAATIAGPIQPD